MLRNIIKQIWNQRRMNGWILLELIIAGFFLWTVIDPVYMLMVHHLTPDGYESEGRYLLKFGAYGSDSAECDSTVTSEQRIEAFTSAARLLRECPEVESVAIAQNSSFPNSGSWNGSTYYADTAHTRMVGVRELGYLDLEGCDMFRTYGMKDALTGNDIVVPEDAAERKLYYVSEGFARQAFGRIDVIGEKFYDYDHKEYEVGGVFKDVKMRDFQAVYPTVVEVEKEMYSYSALMHYMYFIVFSLKDGVDADAFKSRLEKEVAPHMKRANFFYNNITTFEEQAKELATQNGTYNTVRLKLSLAVFTLLCIFLGMVGTFWIRCNARRQEVGVMRSMGASRRSIKVRFLTEAALIVTVAFIVSLIAVMNYAVGGNMVTPETNGSPEYIIGNWFLEKTPHFCMVSLLTYLLLLIIALVGTAIPVSRAASVLPADALRDE